MFSFFINNKKEVKNIRKYIKGVSLIAILVFVFIAMIQNGSINELITVAADLLVFAKAIFGAMWQWICFVVESVCKIALALFGV